MNLVYLCNEYPPAAHGGIGTTYQILARGLVSAGHAVTVLGVYRNLIKRVEENDQGVRVIRIPHVNIKGGGSIFDYLQLKRELDQLNINSPVDLLEGTEMSFLFFPKHMPYKKIIRMAGGHHFFTRTLGKKRDPIKVMVEKLSFRSADYFCAVSNFCREVTAKELGLNASQITVIPNPVEVAMFSPTQDAPEEDGLIVFVGTITEKKGVKELIEAMEIVFRFFPAAHLQMVGRDSFIFGSGMSMTTWLKRQISEHTRDKIEFIGEVPFDKVPGYMNKASVCVFPSHMETLGNVIIEAMSMGKAVVATNQGPGPEIIQDGINGILCNPYDPASIAEGILKALRDSKLRSKLGREARREVKSRFSVDKLVNLNIQFYQSCLER